jgi:flagellum-specific peptidoglycan hydrolase FlgJ
MNVKELCNQFFKLALVNTSLILPIDPELAKQKELEKQKAKELAKQKEEQEKLLKTRNTKESAEQRAAKNGWTIIELQKTPLTTSGTYSAVKNAVINFLGIKDNVDVITEIFLGQLVVETGLHAANNYNVGNIMAHDKPNQFWKGKVIILHAHEFTGKKEKYWLFSLFRAYDNLNDGIGDWLLFMKNRIPSAIEKAKQGDVEGFVLALKAGGYYTAPVEDYMKGVKNGIRMVQKKMQKERSQIV